MQPAASSLEGVKLVRGELGFGSQGKNGVTVNDPAAWRGRKERDVAVDEMFYYKYFTEKSERERKMAEKVGKRKGEGEDEDDSDEDEDEEKSDKEEDESEPEEGSEVSEGELDEDEVWKVSTSYLPIRYLSPNQTFRPCKPPCPKSPKKTTSCWGQRTTTRSTLMRATWTMRRTRTPTISPSWKGPITRTSSPWKIFP
jgi:hypothetical protein